MVKVSVLHNLDQSRDEETWQKWWNGDLIPHLMPFALKLEIIRAEIVCPPVSPELPSNLIWFDISY